MSASVFYGALIFERESSAIPAILPVKQPLTQSAFLDCTVFTNVLTVSQIHL